MVFLLLILVVVSFVYFQIKRLYILPSVSFYIINLLSLTVYCYLNADNLSVNTIIFYLVLNLFVFVSSINLNHKRYNEGLNLEKTLTFYGSIEKVIRVYVLIDIALLILFLLDVDLDILYYNANYLTMVDTDKIGIDNPILIIFHRSMLMNGLISAFSVGYLLSLNKNKMLQLLLIGIASVFFLLEAGANSRSAALIIFTFILSIVIFHPFNIRKISLVVVFFVAGFMSYFAALHGRGNIRQGISQITNNYSEMSVFKIISPEFLADNILGGASTFAQAEIMDSEYPFDYKLLSFSPLPSSVDQFDKLLRYQHRISAYVPYNANSEVYHFGGYFIVLYFILIYISLRYINIVILKNKVLGLLFSLPAYIFFIANQQYPLRNYLRFLLLSGLISFLYVKLFLKKKGFVKSHLLSINPELDLLKN